MAFADDIRNAERDIVQRMRSSFEMARRGLARRRTYSRTVYELNALSQRELDDLGIARANIPLIARDAAREG
jgi:uncharacterized protein YjiS (DUF1127 family)